jgi:hypothetical protein
MIFSKYHEYLKSKKAVPRTLRDTLMCSLHYKHGFEFAKLAKLFKLSKRYAKQVIKENINRNVMPKHDLRELIQNREKQLNIDNLIMGRVHSNKGIITVSGMQ